MIRVALFLSLLFCQVFSAEAESQGVMKLRSLEGLSLDGQALTDSIANGMVWDFSQAQPIGRISARYFSRDDSVVMELMPDCRLDYARSFSAPRLICIEGRTWRIVTDSVPIDGQHISGDTASISMDLSRRLALKGVTRQNLTSGHTVIFEAGDTLRNTILLHIRFDGSSKWLDGDSAMNAVAASRMYWFAGNDPWPVAVGSIVDDRYTSLYIFPKSLNDSQNTPSKEIASYSPYVAIQNHDYLLSRAIARNPGYNREETGAPSDLTEELLHAGIQTSVSDSRLTVTVPEGIEVGKPLLTDILGRVIPPTHRSETQIIFDTLPAGDYIFTVTINSRPLTHKFYIPASR